MKYLLDIDPETGRANWVDPHIVLSKRASQVRAQHGAPMILNGSLDNVWNPATGKKYTCKRAYERETIAAGGRIVGNDIDLSHPTMPEPKLSAKADLAKAFEKHGR